MRQASEKRDRPIEEEAVMEASWVAGGGGRQNETKMSHRDQEQERKRERRKGKSFLDDCASVAGLCGAARELTALVTAG